MTETSIQLRHKKQLHQKMINHFAMERMREILASKDDLSKEMIEKMGMEEMLSYLEEDYKTATLQQNIGCPEAKETRRHVGRGKRDKNQCTPAKETCRAARTAAMSAEEIENKRATKRTRDNAKNAAMSVEEREDARKRKRHANMSAEEREIKINAPHVGWRLRDTRN
jgi:hypothetical protein